MTDRVKAPSGRDIWRAVREELRLNLYGCPTARLRPPYTTSTCTPTTSGRSKASCRGSCPSCSRRSRPTWSGSACGTTRRRRVLGRLLQQDNLAPVEVPLAGWDIRVAPDQDGELRHGQLGIISSLTLPAAAAAGGTPTTRIVKSVVGAGRRRAPPRTSRKARTHEAFNGPNPPIVARARGRRAKTIRAGTSS